jgi:hypothetical protein
MARNFTVKGTKNTETTDGSREAAETEMASTMSQSRCGDLRRDGPMNGTNGNSSREAANRAKIRLMVDPATTVMAG